MVRVLHKPRGPVGVVAEGRGGGALEQSLRMGAFLVRAL